MNTYVALLRAVNVGGRGKISMADLRSFAAALGLMHARTLLNSGNLVFGSERSDTAEVEELLETEAETRLGLRTTFFVRGAVEWPGVLAANPFPEVAREDPGHLHVLFLRDAPSDAEVRAVEAAIVGRERIGAHGRELYAVYPDGAGRSKLTNTVIQRAVGGPCTARNWNTVSKLAEMVAE